VEHLISLTYLLLYSCIAGLIWKKSYGESGIVMTGMRLLVAFMLFRCAYVYLFFETDLETRILALNSLSVAFLSLLAGQLVTNKILIYPAKYEVLDDEFTSFKLIVLVVLLFAVAVVLYQGVPAGFRFWDIVGSSEMSSLRREVSKSYVFGNSEYRGQGVFRTVIEILGAFLFSYIVVTITAKKKLVKTVPLVLLLLIVVLVLMSEGSRGMLMNAVVASMCSYLYFNPKVKKKYILVSALIVVVLFFASSFMTSKSVALRSGGVTFSEFTYGVVERLFMSNSINDVYLFEASKSSAITSGELYWLIRDFKASIPGLKAGKPLAYELYYYRSGDLTGTTYLTGTHMMKAYMDGGYLSVLFQYFVLGLIISLLDKVVSRKLLYPVSGRPVVACSIAGTFALFLGLSFITGIIGTLVNVVILMVVVVVGVGALSTIKIFGKSNRHENTLSF